MGHEFPGIGELMIWQYEIRRMLDPGPLDKCLTQMGVEGWELVCAIPDASMFATLVFKRPVEGVDDAEVVRKAQASKLEERAETQGSKDSPCGRDEKTQDKGLSDAEQDEEAGQADACGDSRLQADPDQWPEQEGGQGVRRRGRPKGSKNKPKSPQKGQELEVVL